MPGTKIKSGPVNNVLADIAEALTGSLPRDGSAPVSGDLDVQGDLDVTGRVRAAGVASSGEVRGEHPNAFRAVFGGRGVILRNDGRHAFLLQTAAGDPDGSWNTLRPLYWDLETGALVLDDTGAGARFGGPLAVAGDLTLGGLLKAPAGGLGVVGSLGVSGKLGVAGALGVDGALDCAGRVRGASGAIDTHLTVGGTVTCGPGGSFAANPAPSGGGYQKLPSGVILQWGIGTTNQYGGLSFAWPVVFPSAFRAMTAAAVWNAPRAVCATQGACDRGGGTVWLTYGEGTPATGVGFSYLAVGF